MAGAMRCSHSRPPNSLIESKCHPNGGGGARDPWPGTYPGSLGSGFSCFRCVTGQGLAVFGPPLPLPFHRPEPTRKTSGDNATTRQPKHLPLNLDPWANDRTYSSLKQSQSHTLHPCNTAPTSSVPSFQSNFLRHGFQCVLRPNLSREAKRRSKKTARRRDMPSAQSHPLMPCMCRCAGSRLACPVSSASTMCLVRFGLVWLRYI